MRVIRVIPRAADSEREHFHAVRDSASNSGLKIGARSRYRDTVELKRSSVEIAFAACLEAVDRDEEDRRDICVETEVVESSENVPPAKSREDAVSATIVADNAELRSESLRIEENPRDVTREATHREKSRNYEAVEYAAYGFESVDREKRNRVDRTIEVEKEKCNNNWWKEGGQTILQFFARILGKRTGMGAKGPADRVVSPSSKQRVKRVSRGDKGRNKRRRAGVDGALRLKRVSKGYIAATRRNEHHRHEAETADDESREEKPSILVRQIQRTRDKNLRISLLERELRARLPRKDRVRLSANRMVNVRQLSSPLC